MGANQSSGDGSSGAGRGDQADEVKTCYYELLGIDPKASEDEIKKAYRKKALELHPDRNYGNVEAATKRFADVQSAYEVLSDPQEKAWYDTHRGSILKGGNNNGEHYEQIIRVTTAEDIMRLFSKFNSHIDFSDSQKGFYGALRDLFQTLAKEEEAACGSEGMEPIQYPSFGHKDDTYEDVVRPFYATWNGFTTKKSFSWKDLYHYSEAPDRKVRRMMEKENKRFRDEGVREFNDAVRSLVAFVRKRDPRFKPNKQCEIDRQKVLKDAAVAQATRSRAANQAKVTEAVPEWMRASVPEAGDVFDSEWAESNPAKEEVECVVCNKIFKSEKQYEAHERSKKHVKTVQQMRRQMQRENRDLDLAGSEMMHDPLTRVSVDTDELPQDEEETDEFEHHDVQSHRISREDAVAMAKDVDEEAPTSPNGRVIPDGSESDSGSDEDYVSREKFKQRLFDNNVSVQHDSELHALAKKIEDETLLDKLETTKKLKFGKAKEKRAKKAAQRSSVNAGTGGEFKCAACQEGFPSKTRLFNHIKDLGHAQKVQKATKGGMGKRV